MNNNPKSNTRQYSTTTYSSRRKRNKKHGQSKFILFVLLALLIIALIVAISIVVIDLVGSDGGDDTSGGGSNTAAPGVVDGDHSMSCAIDNKDDTYLLSAWEQSEGSYFSCEFEAEAAVGSVRLVSNEPDYYIRGCDVSIPCRIYNTDRPVTVITIFCLHKSVVFSLFFCSLGKIMKMFRNF